MTILDDELFHVSQNTGRLDEYDTIKMLIDKCDYVSALMLSCRHNYLTVVKFLIENTAVDIHFDNEEALKQASVSGYNFELIKFLLELGADIHVDHEMILMDAVRRCQVDMVKFLVENGADIHANDNILAEACVIGSDIVKFLVEQGCIPDDKAIRNAFLYRQYEIARYLKEYTTQQDIERCFENKEKWVDGCEHPDKKIVLKCCFKTVCEDCYQHNYSCCRKYIRGKISF